MGSRLSTDVDPLGPDRSARKANLAGAAVVAYTTEADGHPLVRAAAQAHAAEHRWVVILYVADVASAFSEPLPNQWDAEGEPDQFGDRLDADDLDVLGRGPVARQVREATAAGVKVAAWLPKDHGPGALADYALLQHSHLIFVPDELVGVDRLSSALSAASSTTDELTKPGIEVRVIPPPDRPDSSSEARPA